MGSAATERRKAQAFQPSVIFCLSSKLLYPKFDPSCLLSVSSLVALLAVLCNTVFVQRSLLPLGPFAFPVISHLVSSYLYSSTPSRSFPKVVWRLCPV